MLNEELKIIYLEDMSVDEELDRKIRTILLKCFPHESKFLSQRYANDIPKHRFYIEADGEVIAHLAAHEKEFCVNGRKALFIGIAEVCVLPEFRGRGIVRRLLEKAEEINPGALYSILLGKAQYYSSSGYTTVDNIFFTEAPEEPAKLAMVKCLGESKWTPEKVVIEGAPF